MRVIVCGSRRWAWVELIESELFALPLPITLVHGACEGADLLAASVGRALGFAIEAHPADWKRYGKAAGPRRNAVMVLLGADLVFAFRLRGPSPGTDDLLRRATAAGIPTRVVEAIEEPAL